MIRINQALTLIFTTLLVIALPVTALAAPDGDHAIWGRAPELLLPLATPQGVAVIIMLVIVAPIANMAWRQQA